MLIYIIWDGMRVSLVQMKRGRLRDFCSTNSSQNVNKGRNEKLPKFSKPMQIPLTKFISVEELMSVTPNKLQVCKPVVKEVCEKIHKNKPHQHECQVCGGVEKECKRLDNVYYN